MNGFGLTEEAVMSITRVFRSHPVVERAILYGSRAKGDFKPGSDIDLTLVGRKIQGDELAKIEQELDDLLLPYKFDLSLLHNVTHPGLLEHINRVGKVLFQSEMCITRGMRKNSCGSQRESEERRTNNE